MLTNDGRGLSERKIAEKARESRRYWDAHPISTDLVAHAPGTRESFEAIYERWSANADRRRLEFLASCRGKRILEVGCGIGIDGRAMAEHGANYHGLDHSFRSLQLAQQNFDQADLSRKNFVNGDAATLPFRDGHFDMVVSIGVLMCVPAMNEACRELVRVLRPGGTVRVMLYNRHSYHYALVSFVVRPLIWLILRVRVLEVLLPLMPAKARHMYAICKQAGYSRERVLATSADTSFAGADNFIPVSGFFTGREMRELFPGLEDYRFFRSDLKYFPLSFLRGWVESRWGFFLTLTARKPAGAATA